MLVAGRDDGASAPRLLVDPPARLVALPAHLHQAHVLVPAGDPPEMLARGELVADVEVVVAMVRGIDKSEMTPR